MREGARFEVSKEVYERSKERGGYMADEDLKKNFSAMDLYGYGVYGAKVYEQDGKYYCTYMTGDSCD